MVSIKSKKILGIDPGTNVMGYALIECAGNKVSLLQMGVVKTSGFQTHYEKLNHLFARAEYLVQQYMPDEMAIEAPFFGKNVQSMLKLGRAQGAIMIAALKEGIPVEEYAPLKVKMAITGMGGASKEQVAYFLGQIFKNMEKEKELDATDALAVAYCHFLQASNPLKEKSYKNWKDFIDKNPKRIR